GGRSRAAARIMRCRGRALPGVCPADIPVIDQTRRPRAGDLVCAQVTDLATGATGTVMRRFEPPFIVAHSARMEPQRPELVDDERVVIMGVQAGLLDRKSVV